MDSDDDREDDLSSDDSYNNLHNIISSESCEEDKDSGRRSVTHVDSAGSESTERNSSAVSLLSVLKAPKPSALSRKHLVLQNPPRRKKRCRGNSTHDPSNIKPMQHVKEYPDEPFIVSNSKLFCTEPFIEYPDES